MFGFKKRVKKSSHFINVIYDDFQGVKVRKGARRPVADPALVAMAAELESRGWIRDRLLDNTVIVHDPRYDIGYTDDIIPPYGTRPLGTGEYLYRR